MLSSFVCDNYEDEKLMQQLIANNCARYPVNQRPRLIVSDFKAKLHDWKKFRPEYTQYSTIYEMLKIEDHVIANTLMDQRRVESILLLPDYKTGEHIIQNNSTNNCNEAYLINGDNLKGLPSFRMYSCPNHVKAKYFISNTQLVIESNTREIAELSKTAASLKGEIKELNGQLVQNTNLKKNTDNQMHSMGKVKINLNAQLRDAQNIHIPEPIDLAVFEDEIENMSTEIAEIEQNISRIEANSFENKTEYEKALNEKTKADEEHKKYTEQIDKIKGGFTDIENKRGSSKEAIKHYKNLLNQLIETERPVEQRLAECKGELEKFTALAVNLCPRIETTRTVRTIQNEEAAITKQIAESLKLHGDEEAIISEYKTKREKFNSIKNDIKKQKKFLDRLKKVLEQREESIKHFTRAKALNCALQFANYVQSRNYSGHLKFDHDDCTLDIIVQPNKTRGTANEKQTTDLKSLSGGERSFSTVAFLLSLWSIVESPILFLDEFDVFMDQINRSFAMDLILDAARKQLNGQYMFLTPQETGSVKSDKYVKLFKMPDPKRNIDMIQER